MDKPKTYRVYVGKLDEGEIFFFEGIKYIVIDDGYDDDQLPIVSAVSSEKYNDFYGFYEDCIFPSDTIVDAVDNFD